MVFPPRSSLSGLALLSLLSAWGSAHATATAQESIAFRSIHPSRTGNIGNIASGYTCAVAAGGALYCWGRDLSGDQSPGSPVSISRGRTFTSMDAGEIPCATTAEGATYCWNPGFRLRRIVIDSSEAVPIARLAVIELHGPNDSDRVPGDLSFIEVSTATGVSCGLTADSTAYCWGSGGGGSLGNGTRRSSDVPRAVVGGLKFRSIRVGTGHTCGLTANGAAYCWGDQRGGRLGHEGPGSESCVDMGGRFPCRSRPVPVQGGLAFVSLSAGTDHTCAITAQGSAYCWGSDMFGQLGRGSQSFDPGARVPYSSRPAPVVGGHAFATISAGMFHTCGLTVDGATYCWGQGPLGAEPQERCLPMREPGAGLHPGPCSTRPLLVGGGHTFRFVASGDWHSCALTVEGVAYCWGSNTAGQLGDGSRQVRLTPVRVIGPR